MRAAIDIGSNSVRLALNGEVRSVITKLADGIESTGKLSPVGVENTVAALKYFKTECDAAGATEIFAFATEAVRRATDGKEFIDRVKREIGLNIVLLSPEREAEFALFGTTKPDGAVTVCDLGGGSLEVISSRDGVHPDYVKSLPIGVVVAKNRYAGDYARAIAEMPSIVSAYGSVPAYPVVLTGGSACAIASCILNLKVYDKAKVTSRFTAQQLDDIMPVLLSGKLAVLRPVAAKRADTAPYGGIILQALLNHLNATEFYVSDSSNLEAALKLPLENL